MPYDDGSQALVSNVPLVVAGRTVGTDAHLPGLEHDRANLAGLCLLLLQAAMQFKLCRIEGERYKASSLRPDFQVLLSEIGQIGLKTLGMVEVVTKIRKPRHAWPPASA